VASDHLQTIIDRPLDEQTTTQNNMETLTFAHVNEATLQPTPSTFTALAQNALQVFHNNEHLHPIIVQG
jgi:hypothetical protein